MYTLYGHPFSQHSRRVVSLLEVANIDYEFEVINLMSGQHMTPDFLAINPNHQVPALISDEVQLYESNAILRYLCNKHQLNDWYSIAPEERAIVDLWLDWIQCRMSPAVVGIVLNKVFLGKDGDTNAVKQSQKDMIGLSTILENRLNSHKFIAGESVSIADLALASNLFQLGLAGEVPTSQAIQAWYTSIMSREAVQKSLPTQE